MMHNDDEVIITENPHILEIVGPGCIIRAPDLSAVRYMAHRLEMRNITLGTLGWIPEWILEVYMENCQILSNTAEPGNKLSDTITNLPQNIIQLTCRGCNIPVGAYSQLSHHRLIRLDLLNQGLTKLPESISEYAPNLLFMNLNNNCLSEKSVWPLKIRGLRLSGNKLMDLVHLGQLPPYLEDLDLSNNRFSEIPTHELPQFLQKLNMSQNELNWLPEDPSEYPPNLRELNIARNCGLDDLTDAGLPDMLKTLIAAECEISKLPHDWHCYCLANMDLSDNNITNLDELPFDKVMNINYVGNPCWQPSSRSSPNTYFDDNNNLHDDLEIYNADVFMAENQITNVSSDYIDDDSLLVPNSESDNNSVFTSGPPSPEPYELGMCNYNNTSHYLQLKNDDTDYMSDYKAAISKSSSQDNLNSKNKDSGFQTIYSPVNDPLINAIDYVMTSGIRKVGSILTAMSDILTPDMDTNQTESIYESPSNQNSSSIGDKVLDELDYYGGIFGAFN